MIEIFGFVLSYEYIYKVLVSLSFFGGVLVMLCTSKEFEPFVKILEKEHGFTKRLFPSIENIEFDIINRFVARYRFVLSFTIVVVSYLLLLNYK